MREKYTLNIEYDGNIALSSEKIFNLVAQALKTGNTKELIANNGPVIKFTLCCEMQ